jgi:hypothetical protein
MIGIEFAHSEVAGAILILSTLWWAKVKGGSGELRLSFNYENN